MFCYVMLFSFNLQYLNYVLFYCHRFPGNVRQAKLLMVSPMLPEIHVLQVNLYFTLLSSRFQNLENAYEQTFVQ